jgi:hypothetical protein
MQQTINVKSTRNDATRSQSSNTHADTNMQHSSKIAGRAMEDA